MYGCTDKPVERPGSVAILDRARESLAGLAEMAVPWFRPLVRQSAEVVEELAPFVSPVPVNLIDERVAAIVRELRDSANSSLWSGLTNPVFKAIDKLSAIQADLRGPGPEEMRTIPVADAAGRTS